MVTVITKTIGPNPAPPALPEYDYGSFTDAEADVENIATAAFGSTDLVASDGAIVFEAAAGTYNEPSQVLVQSALTTDATRHVTYKAAPGSEHGGILGAGVFIFTSSNGFNIEDANTHLIGLGVRAQFNACYTLAPGTVARDCIFEATTNHGFIGVQNASVVAENCVSFHQGVRYGFYLYVTSGYTASGKYINCTAINTAPSGGYNFNFNSPGGTITAEVVNCLGIGDETYRVTATGPVTVTGSNNFGVSNFPFPVALQGSPATITPSTAYDPGAGDFALYVGKNGALLDSPNNDVIGGGVGPSVNSDVPTTDILGNERSGALANPGAFEVPQAPTVITRTIGPNPAPPALPEYDYGSFTDAEAAVATIGTSADLVFNNERIVFEADAGTYSESVIFQSTLTTDATRNVTYKAATGSEHGGEPSAGVIISDTYPVEVDNENYTVFDGLHLDGLIAFQNNESGGTVCRNLILSSSGSYGFVGAPATSIPVAPITLENCAVISATYSSLELRATTVAGTTDYKVTNCTLVGAPRGVRVGNNGVAGSVINLDAINNLALTNLTYLTAGSGTINESGSNNFGGSTNPFPVAIQGSPYPITASTSYDPGAGDYALYVASNGALLDSPNNDVIGQGLSFLDGAGDVPGYDIQGNPRGAKISNPGAFEIPQGPTVVTKTIGSDKDYPDFTTAEAAVETIATLEFGSTDLVANNGAIVFEADAGLYEENVTFASTLTTDQTRNVTYKAAASSEHGGVPGAGVKIIGLTTTTYTLVVEDRFMVLSGLEVVSEQSSSIHARSGGDGTTVENCILSPWIYAFITFPVASVTNATYYIRNCVFRALRSGAVGYDTRGAAGATTSYVVTNCSAFDGSVGFRHAIDADAASTTSLTLVNNWSGNCDRAFLVGATGTVTVTGSNNFGGSTDPFPVALQGSPYPVTATTDTDPGPGDWAIYDAATGALIDDPDNDVLGGGVGPDADADVPTTDIVGNIRSGDTTDPGAFQRPALDTIMRQIYQQDAPFAIGASPSGVSGITHQPGPAALDYFTINSTTSATITVPRTAHAMRIVCAIAAKACDVTLELDASNSVYLGTIGGIASVQADIDYFWSFASVASDGAYPRVKIEHDGVFSGDQQVYLWWHLA